MSAARSYIPPVEIDEVMRALAAGRVIASGHRRFAPGGWGHGPFGVQEHAVSDGQDAYKIEVTGRPHGMILLSSAFSVFSET